MHIVASDGRSMTRMRHAVRWPQETWGDRQVAYASPTATFVHGGGDQEKKSWAELGWFECGVRRNEKMVLGMDVYKVAGSEHGTIFF